MRTLLKRLMWLGAIFLIVWIAVVLYWQSTTRLPSETDLLLYLGVLPLALCGLAWGGYKLATREPKPASPDQAAGKDKAATDAARHGAEQEKAWTMNIVAASVQAPAGSTAADVLAKLKEGPIQAELDPELKNEDGFPVFSSRIADLDVSETQDTFKEWLKNSSQPDLAWSDNQYRALHLAGLSMRELLNVVVQHADLVQYLQLQEIGRNQHKLDAVVPLRLVLIWPAYWPASHQSAASDWVKDMVAEQGWPAAKIIVQAGKSGAADAVHPVALLDHITVTSRRGQLPTVGIMLACQSGIDQEYVDALAAKNTLFSGKNSSGTMPGELAAGFIFADDKHAKLLGDLPVSVLHRASWAAREKSADEAGRVTATLLGDIVSLALESAKLDITKIKHVITDNDHKPSREAELAEMLTAKFPELDCNKDTYKTAQACGGAQHATTVAALCVAHQYVVDEKTSVMCTSLHDAHLRAAVVMGVATEPNSADAATVPKAV